MFVRYWQWFLLSVIICLCAAQLYLFRVTPAYRISGKLMISAADKFNPHIPSKYRNRYYAKHDLQMDINNVGTVSNTQGLTGTGHVSSQRNLFLFRTGSRPKLLYNLLITNKMKRRSLLKAEDSP